MAGGRTGTPLAALMLDIDHFKKVNDSRGHACGDAALHGLAVVLEHHVRRTDLLGRLGGEEFVAFCQIRRRCRRFSWPNACACRWLLPPCPCTW